LTPRHVLLAALGSLGDLHPALAIAIELRTRGHRVTLVSHEMYRAKVEAEGVGFAALPPNLADLGDISETMRKAMEGPDASRYVIRRFVLPYMEVTYDAIMAASHDADLLVSHPLTFAVPIVAEKRGLPWASTALQPLVLFSALDPSVWPQVPWLEPWGRRHPGIYRAFFTLGKAVSRPWMRPVARLRASAGLPPSPLHPSFEGMVSPRLHLVLFSRAFAAPQADWPPSSVQCGFAFYDREEKAQGLAPGLAAFLAAGPPPIVFTLGSSAVHAAGGFYADAARVAARMGRRAVLLTGRETNIVLPDPLPAGIAAFPYAPFSELFPCAAANVHQGGAGTTGQALRAGRPMVVVPFAHDQEDHAARIERLGAGLALPRARCDEARLAAALGRVLEEPGFAARAAKIGAEVRAENGAAVAADAIERLLAVR
jgi:UDP:flavonoid glycosyltransferase YjiC (YdhE family)